MSFLKNIIWDLFILQWLLPTSVNEEDKNYRRSVIANVVIAFSFLIMVFFTVFHFFISNITLFYLDSLILIVLLLVYLYFRKKSIYLIANMMLFTVSCGLLFLIYYNQGKDSVVLWSIVLLFYLMPLHGYKRGLFLSSLFFFIVFFMLYHWIGESISFEGYIRFIVVCIILVIISFIHEYSTQKTLKKIHSMKNQLNELIKIDSLTSIYNRRYFDEIFFNERKYAQRNKILFVFLMIDIDFFKLYNDLYGHQEGDNVLIKIAASFKNAMKRPNDYVFRLGGEEFGICFSGENISDILQIIEKIRVNIENLKIAHAKNTASSFVTVSIGASIFNSDEEYSKDEIYKMTDTVLYQAKYEGRNRVSVSSQQTKSNF